MQYVVAPTYHCIVSSLHHVIEVITSTTPTAHHNEPTRKFACIRSLHPYSGSDFYCLNGSNTWSETQTVQEAVSETHDIKATIALIEINNTREKLRMKMWSKTLKTNLWWWTQRETVRLGCGVILHYGVGQEVVAWWNEDLALFFILLDSFCVS